MMDAPADENADAPGPETDRYGHLSLNTGDVVIYDRDDPDTYIQSDYAVEL